MSFGPCLFRALSVPGVPVACVAGPLEQYGFLPTIRDQAQRLKVLETFSHMYQPIEGSGVMEYLGTTGLDGLKGADILKVAPGLYKSDGAIPEHHDRAEAAGHRPGASRGSRHPGVLLRPRQLRLACRAEPAACRICGPQVTEGLEAFMTDLREHDAADNVIVLMFSEFGRRVRDNGSGTDHGAAGATFVLGDKVKGGHYGEYPSLEARQAGAGRPEPEHGLPQHLLDHSRQVAGHEPGADRERHVREAGLPALSQALATHCPVPGCEPGTRARSC